MEINLTNKTAVISGGLGCIGSEITKLFAKAGARVYVIDIQSPEDAFVKVLKDLDGIVSFHMIDATKPKEISKFYKKHFFKDTHIDYLINNIGIAGPRGSIEKLDLNGLEELFTVNVFSFFYMCSNAVPLLKKAKNPSIVNISSVSGNMGYKNRSAYSSSKWAVMGLTKSLAIELGQFNIRVNSVSPGATWGAPIENAIKKRATKLGVTKDVAESHYLSQSSMKRLVNPKEVAWQVLFLCLDESKSITSQDISVDAGTFILH